MRLIPSGTALRLAAAAAFLLLSLAGAVGVTGAPAEDTRPAAQPVTLSATASMQDVTAALRRHRVDLGAGANGDDAAQTLPRRDGPWFSLTFANPSSLPVERLLMVRRPLLAGAAWSAGAASALPQGSAVQWTGAGAPEPLPAATGAGGAGVFRFTVPAGGTARLAIPGQDGPVNAAVMTRAAYDDLISYRFVIMGFGFGLLGVIAALSFARWLGAGDRTAAASAALGLAAIWVLATQFGHHLLFIEAGSAFDPGFKAAGLYLLAGALLFCVRMQAALSERLMRLLTWAATGCAILAAVALPGGLVILAAGPVLLAAALLSLAVAIRDAWRPGVRLTARLPDLAALTIVVAALLAAGALAAVAEPSLAADRWAMMLYGALVVSLAVLGGSGLLHHGAALALPAPIDLRAPDAPEPVLPPAPADIAEIREPGAAMADALRAAVEGKEIGVEYEPIIRLADGSVSGFEALARWQWEGRSVSPEDFIPVAEESGLIADLGAQILAEAVRRLGDWQRAHIRDGAPLRMNVNISARQLCRPGFAATVQALVKREGVDPDCLTLELTESLPFEDPGRAADTARRLKECGVRLALDDFGAGQSSLARLGVLPFDDLKIDRSLLAAVDEPRGRRILGAVISLAHDLGMKVVAEGVRSAADLESLRAMRCDFVQGAFCGPPLSAEAAGAALQRDAGRRAKSESPSFSAGSV